MPPVFTKMFAQRLDGKCALSVKEAEDGDVVAAGRILIAPGDRHMEVRRVGNALQVKLTQGPPENFCRPAVDVLFRSVAAAYGQHVLAAVLTGMGSDGARGAEVLRRGGAEVLAQDEASSVVWGMPGAVVGAGLAHRVLPLNQLAREITGCAGRGRSIALTGAAR
jgi:two-component system chemotaxis response regulator CheB